MDTSLTGHWPRENSGLLHISNIPNDRRVMGTNCRFVKYGKSCSFSTKSFVKSFLITSTFCLGGYTEIEVSLIAKW